MVRVAGLHDQVDAGHRRARAQDGRSPAEMLDAHPRARARADARARPRCLEQRRCAPRSPSTASASSAATSVDAEQRERARRALPAPDLPGADAARRRPRPAVPLHLQPVAVARACSCATRQTGAGDLRAREGAEGDAAALRRRSATAARSCRSRTLIAEHLDALFPGMEIVDYDVFRVTRDADFTVSDEADDLLQAVEDELRRRRFGEVVRVEVGAGMSPRAARAARATRWSVEEGERLRGRRAARPQRPVGHRQACRASPSCATRRGRP